METKQTQQKREQDYDSLPYRLGVGMMIVNDNNQILIARRIDSKSNTWQMPQGGIDLGETPSGAVMREMEEELGCNKGEIIAESKHWYSYHIPKFLIPRLWDGKYRGQKQKWFLIKFTGDDSDININTTNPEFMDWRWVDSDKLVASSIPFKRRLYAALISEFAFILHSIAQIRDNKLFD
ncbi:RNA pyrophosphohydrolase [Rickettsiales endosymbiont of Paramecium tredecaurelia]|uniref:RNA pyrophosphohydrolase n=1 Tax=Candidatus Sarmatiella mevalonica TaxID=2770581 RepID=UPI001920AB3B|nr:RNA pyrophosphohydrolase [Candidatus Sarmatiella mevalonica]MBL3284401.1 RNA pyrophosphohydrolase [Candidatus Sarmatiella mevalonica]